MVSWKEVQEFIRKLNGKVGGGEYRLPTEAEWEYSARAGTTTGYFFGDEESMLGDYAWYSGNSGYKTHGVGQKKPNPWGLYDMYGNVWEWVQDAHHYTYSGAPTDGRSWGSEGDPYDQGIIWVHRVCRGGQWGNRGKYCRSALRNGVDPGAHSEDIGFRLARDL